MTIDEQIAWLTKHIRHMKKAYPERVEKGQMTQEKASYLLCAAQATLETVTQLRGLVLRGGRS